MQRVRVLKKDIAGAYDKGEEGVLLPVPNKFIKEHYKVQITPERIYYIYRNEVMLINDDGTRSIVDNVDE
jgi:hypothetical protein